MPLSTSAVTVVEDDENPVSPLLSGISTDAAFTFMFCELKGGVQLQAGSTFVIVKKNKRDAGEFAKLHFLARVLKKWSPEQQCLVTNNSNKQFLACVETSTEVKTVPLRHLTVYYESEHEADLAQMTWMPDVIFCFFFFFFSVFITSKTQHRRRPNKLQTSYVKK